MRFNNIQIARLAAALGVVTIHLFFYAKELFGAGFAADPRLGFHWVGPFINPLFFAVSGFVLSHVLQKASPPRFVFNRVLRLYPGYWMALGLVTGLTAAGLWPGPYFTGEPDPSVETILAVPVRWMEPGRYPLFVEWTLIYEVILWIGLIVLWCVAGKKRLPIAVAVWLLVLAVKSVVAPNYGSRMIPTWKSVWVSVFVAPFLLGVLAYYLRTVGRGWRWPVLVAVVGLNAAAWLWVPLHHVDYHYWLRSVAAGLTLWFLVQIPDADPWNPLVVGGGYSYGLYLLHVPLMLFAFRCLQVADVCVGSPAGVLIAGLFALVVGLLFGRFEVRVHAWLKRRTDRRPAAQLPLPWKLPVGSRQAG